MQTSHARLPQASCNYWHCISVTDKHSQVEAGDAAKRQLAHAEARILELERQLAAARDATREAEAHLQRDRAAHGPAESAAELKKMIAALQRDAAARQAKLDKSQLGLDRMQAIRTDAETAAKDMHVRLSRC